MKLESRASAFLPLSLLGLAGLVYGFFLPRWGFYWDDWIFAWLRSQQGAAGLWADFATSRPLRGLTEPLFSPLLGLNPLAWQIWGLLTRWLAAWAFGQFLLSLWPQRKSEAWLAAALFLVYPGFGQQPLAMTYHYFWMVYALFFLSLAVMTRALQAGSPRWSGLTLALLLAATAQFASEYLTGLEILRPLVIFAALPPTWRGWQRLRQSAWQWIPYLAMLSLYGMWRFVWFNRLYSAPTYSPTLGAETTSLTGKLLNLLQQIWQAQQWAYGRAWLPGLQPPPESPWLIGLMLLAGAGIFLTLRRLPAERQPAWQWIFGGGLAALSASLPFAAAGLPVRFIFPDDRFAIPFLAAIPVFAAGALSLRPGLLRWGGAILLLLSVNAQMRNGLAYAEEWSRQKSFLWQLTWRAPGLEPETIFLAEDGDTFRFDDYEALWVMVSWTYAPQNTSRNYPFPYHQISMRPDVIKSAPRALALRYAPPACLHLLDPQRDFGLFGLKTPLPGTLPSQTAAVLPLADLNLIRAEATSAAPPAFLGEEPAHRWCFFYQQAELARQRGDWAKVLTLLKQAGSLRPDDSFEYLPFVEALARGGEMKLARALTRQAVDDSPLLKPVYCALWRGLADELDSAASLQAASMADEIGFCPER